MTILQTLILAIVEGITEFLPISSTAHLQIAEKILSVPPTDFVKSFTLVVQVGALLGTALYIFTKRQSFIFDIKKIAVSCVPTLLVGFVLYKLVKGYFFGNFVLIGWALILGGIVMMIAEQYSDKRAFTTHVLDFKKSFILGLAQALAVVPGVSRSGAVLVGGYFLGIEKKYLAQFSFLIGLPIVFVASVYDVIKTPIHFSQGEIGMTILGTVVSGIFSYFVAGWFLKILSEYSIRVFAWYRIVFGILVLLLL